MKTDLSAVLRAMRQPRSQAEMAVTLGTTQPHVSEFEAHTGAISDARRLMWLDLYRAELQARLGSVSGSASGEWWYDAVGVLVAARIDPDTVERIPAAVARAVAARVADAWGVDGGEE